MISLSGIASTCSDGSSLDCQAQLCSRDLICLESKPVCDKGRCLRGPLSGCLLARNGYTQSVENLGPLVVWARRMHMALAVAIGGVEVGQPPQP